MARLLIEKGADITNVNRFGDTVLSEAIVQGLDKVVELLIQKGVNVNVVGRDNRTALIDASIRGKYVLNIKSYQNLHMASFFVI